MTQNWASSFPLQMMPIPSIPMGSGRSATSAVQPPSWVDEFLDFSFAKRNAHRRFVSDSMSFLPLLEDCPTSSPPTTAAVTGRNIGSFEQLDDEQLKSMFADETAVRMAATVSSCKSNPSTPSDENSDGEKPTQPQPLPPQDHQQRLPKEEPREGDDSCKFDSLPTKPADVTAASGDTIVDPKRVKRILANRQSAQRSRVRKLQYISELERSVTTLQTEVSALSPRVAFLDHQRLILNVDNSAIKQRIAALVQDKIFKDGKRSTDD
ncbi:hypothetical protein U1Q18_045148 [Sarracenia purpurea var. burkii]